MDTSIDIRDGRQQINPAAHTAIQNNYYSSDQGDTEPLYPHTLVVLGAGADATAGLPSSSGLIPGIVDWLATEEGKAVDEALRKQLKRLTFRFDRFVDDAIDRLAKDLDSQRDTICQRVREELESNPALDDTHRKMGNLIVRIFQKITDVKQGAAIDEETETLIREVTGLEPTDSTIIDFSRLNYTDTFKSIITHILKSSLHDSSNPILRHVYRNLLDIEQLMAQYFYGFFTGRQGHIKTYLYIVWMLWAYLVHCEQTLAPEQYARSVYHQLRGQEDLQVVTFNYTTLAAEASPSALYFNGNLTDYVDIENKNDLHIDNIQDLGLVSFFQERISLEMSLEGDHIAIPVPSFMPPLKLKPVLSDRYITTWYRTSESIRHAERILILGHSLHAAGSFVCEMVRNNRQAEIIIIDRDIDNVCRHLCSILGISSGYTPMNLQGYPARKYDNRIIVVQAELSDIDLTLWFRNDPRKTHISP